VDKREDAPAETINSPIELCGHETVRPTPDILDALEKDYPLEASIADLVDNSIDAKARNVHIRFVRRGQRLIRLCIADDGDGMTDSQIKTAMQFAARREYGRKDLGMFGVGLKTASLSQAEHVIVASRTPGSKAVGRRWTKSGIKQHDWRLDVLTGPSAARILDLDWGFKGALKCATVVRWDNVHDFDRLHSGVDEYLELARRRIRNHLGLKLHRFLERGKIRMRIDIQDVDEGVGPPSEVVALNPLPPAGTSGASGFPKEYVAKLPGAGALTLRAHIWRRKSRDDGYRLGGGRVAEHQGFYFYRHDRLIQDGGWCGIIGTNEPHMSLARVEIDIPDSMSGYLKVRSNKAGVDVPATFGSAIHEALAADGTSFNEYLEKAEEVYRRRGEVKARPMVAPGNGFPVHVRKALLKRGVQFLRGPDCTITWGKVRGSSFVEIDLSARAIVLNSRYRRMLLRGAHGGKTDLPLMRTLLYFVLESIMSGARIGAAEKRRLEAIQSCMSAALQLEEEWAGD
jgi:Histidine kinase-, DNA gyrase B-, and HSP90-like ATPase